MMKTDSFLKTSALLAVLLAMGVVIAPVMAGEVTKQLSAPYYQQETPYYCGPAVAQMWIDFHNGYISQDTLWNYIQNNNKVSQDVVSLETRGAPGGGVTHPAVWSDTLVRPTLTAGVDRETYYDQMTAYYEAVAKNVTLMADEEDDIPLMEDTDLAAFAREMMTEKFKIHLEELEGAVPGELVFVHSLDEKYGWHDYYLIPFERDGYITVVAQVSIKGDVADFGVSYAPDVKTRSVVRPTLEEARAVLAENGYDSTLPARLVWKPCEQTWCPTVPVWEFTVDDGDTVYVGYVPWKKQVEFYEELAMKKIAG